MSVIAYLGSILLGLVFSHLWHGSEAARPWVEPVLIALMVLTFREIPLTKPELKLKVLGAVLVLNGVVVPAMAWGLVWSSGLPPALAIPALIVLVAPCVDYVVVFTRAAGGAWRTMVALTPILLVAQILALVVWGAGAQHLAWELARAGLLYLALPLCVAIILGKLNRRWVSALDRAMDPVTCLLLLLISTGYGQRLADSNPRVALVYVLFAACALSVATLCGRFLRFPPQERTLLQLTATTRNSLIVLPIAMVIAPEPALAAVVVITQTFVELCVLSLVVWWKKSHLTSQFVNLRQKV